MPALFSTFLISVILTIPDAMPRKSILELSNIHNIELQNVNHSTGKLMRRKTDKTDNNIQCFVCLIRLMYHVSNRLVSRDSKHTDNIQGNFW